MSGFGGGLGGGLSNRTRGRRPASDPLEGLEEWQLLQRAGASEAVVERARLESSVYGPGGTLQSSELLGVEQEDEKRGLLTSFFDFAQRGQSAVTGLLTGLAGLERERVTADQGQLLPDRDRSVEGGLGLAWERFVDGLSGEEQFRAADFGVLAYDRETASTGERFLKSATGFLLDVALDPVTYMSLGGSIFGRVRGAQRVWGAAKTRNRQAVLDAVDNIGVERSLAIVQRTPERLGATTSKIASEVSEALRERGLEGIKPNSSMDDIIEVLRQNPEMAREVAADMTAANMAISYRGGSSSGLRGYLADEFGDVGEQLFKQLPMDVQGGIRMRVPFSALGGKDPKMLFRLPGTEGLSALTNDARHFFRNVMPGTRSLSSQASGAIGLTDKRLASAYYRSQHAGLSKIHGEWLPETNTIGWLDLRATKQAFTDADNITSDLTHKMGALYKKAASHIAAGRRLAESSGEDFDDLFYNRALASRVSGRLGDDGSITPNMTPIDVFGKNPTEVQIEVYNAAVDLQTINQLVLDTGREVFDGKLGRMFEALGEEGEYFPRMVEDMNRLLRTDKKPGGTKPSFLFDRDRYFSFLDDDGNVGNWLNNKQVQDRFGDVFMVEPERVMMAYMTSVTRALRDEMITRNLLRSGVAFRGTRTTEWNETALAREVVDVINKMRARKAAAESIDYVQNPADADRVYNALAGWRGVGPRVYTTYSQRPNVPSGLSAVFESIDGVRIERLDNAMGSYRVRLKNGFYIDDSGKGVKNPSKARVFARRTDAETVANNAMAKDRVVDYQDRASELLTEFKATIADDLSRAEALDPTIPLSASLALRNPMHPANMPLGKQQQEEYIAGLVEIIKEFSDKNIRGFRSRPIVGEQYKEITKGSGLSALAERTELDNNVRGSLVRRWSELGLLTPAALVDDVQRLGAARIKYPDWLEKYYLPFYAVQKSLMTAQRGPGYVVRNIMGGLWNAYLYGVGAKHWKGAAVALSARNEAYAWAKKTWPDGNVRQADAAIKKFDELLRERLGDKAGAEMFNIYQHFDRMQLGGRSIRSRTLGIRATELYEDLPDDIVRAIEGGDVSRFSYQNIADYVGARNRWAQFMTRQATESEDFLRFGSFLRGVDDFGIEDGGTLASMYTLASQFDYTDLSQFERGTLKLIMPFYTWSRNNIPLQFRALMSEPGRVMQALRINDGLRDAFGEPGEEGEPLPVWLRASMSWQVRSDLITGPMGDPLAFGAVAGEPLVDINKLFADPRDGIRNIVNWREAISGINPSFNTAITAVRGIEQSTGGTLPPTEPAPPWAEFLKLGTVNADGERVISSRFLSTMRDTLAPFGSIERLAPQYFGNEKYQRRVLSSWASTLFGVPLRTLDPYQTGAELRTRQNRMQARLREQLGDDYPLYTGWVSQLVELGATANDMALVRETVLGLAPNQSIADLPVERLDYTAAADTIRFLRRMEGLQEVGISEDILERMWETFEPRTDKERNVYAYGPSRNSLTPEQLSSVGLTQQDVADMSPEELLLLLRRFAGE